MADLAAAPAPPRRMLRQEIVVRDGVGLMAADEDISRPTDWRFVEDHHKLVVHLRGHMRSMDSVFAHGPKSVALPALGAIWAIPAQHDYAAQAHGQTVRYAEIRLPPTDHRGRPFEIAPMIGHRDPFLHRSAARLIKLVDARDDLSRMLSRSILETIRLHVLHRYGLGEVESDAASPPPMPANVRRLVESYVQDNLADRLSLPALAAVAGMTVHRFLPAFRAEFGVTPIQYVIRQRLDLARTLLAHTEQDITSIALTAGFYSHSHLTATFTQRFGMPPSAYRRQLRG